jgi:predicted DNA-binding transcriptional regulator AlpA
METAQSSSIADAIGLTIREFAPVVGLSSAKIYQLIAENSPYAPRTAKIDKSRRTCETAREYLHRCEKMHGAEDNA